MKYIALACGVSLWVGACGSTSDAIEDTKPIEPKSIEQPIVNGAPERGLPQVVLLDNDLKNGRRRRCSGTYIAPRLVLTAAHCVRPDTVTVHVYYGNDYLADQAGRYETPPAGQPSVWALADSWQRHPDFDPDLWFPDVAVVFLDRALPMDPLPVAFWPIGQRWVGERATVVGWGANVAKSADLTQTEGFGVKRSGQATILGSPTLSDYHPEDPNRGILDPAIRAKLLKTDGSLPNNANPCAGDSGGPLLVHLGDWDFVAGVEYFGGLWCKDYSLYTRTTAILPFLADSARRLGAEPIALDGCVVERPGGELTAYFGYDNPNGISMELPFGKRNQLALDEQQVRPKVFRPGHDDFGTFLPLARGDRAVWRVDPVLTRPSTVKLDRHSPRCSESDSRFLCDDLCRVGIEATTLSGSPVPTPQQCFESCANDFDWANRFGCVDQTKALYRCAAHAPVDASWWWEESFGPPLPGDEHCAAEMMDAWYYCPEGLPSP